ncbi:unnamed protein product [Calypogeia fissa]
MAKMIWRPPTGENANAGQSAAQGEQRNVRAVDTAGRDDKLEVKSDGAWFSAEITLREDGTADVHFDDYPDGDEVWDNEKIKSLRPLHEHIRVVSDQLQDEECVKVPVRTVVCALRRAGVEEGWHDAFVTEVRKQQHKFGRDGETCTCLFTVVWRDGPAKGQTERDLTCGEICVPSTKSVETHPLILDMLRHANGEGRGKEKEADEAGPSCSAPRVRRKKGDTDDDTESSEEQLPVRRFKRLKPKVTTVTEGEEAFVKPPEPPKQSELAADDHHVAGVRQLRQSEQSTDATKLQEVSRLSPSSTEDSSKPKKRMRGQVEGEQAVSSDLFAARDRILGVKSSEEACKNQAQLKNEVSPNLKPSDRVGEIQLQQKSTPSPNVELQERRVKPKVSTDLTEEAGCEFQTKTKIKAKADPLQERHLNIRPSKVQMKTEDVKAKPDILEEKQLSSNSSETEGKVNPILKQNKAEDLAPTIENKMAFDVKDMEAKANPIFKQKRAGYLAPTVENEIAKAESYATQKTTEILAAKGEAQRPKKVRVTVEFDMEIDGSRYVVEGVPVKRSFPAEAIVTSCSPVDEEELVDFSGRKSEAMPNTCKAAEPKSEVAPLHPTENCQLSEPKDEKLLRSPLKREIGSDHKLEGELPALVDESLGVQKKSTPYLQPKLQDEPKSVPHSLSSAHLGKTEIEDELVDSKSYARRGSAAENAICLSDDEADGNVTAWISKSSTFSTRGIANPSSSHGSGHPFIEERQERWNAAPLQNNRASRNWRSAFIKKVLAKPGCILMIDNLEVDVRGSDLLEHFLKFCDRQKIQSVMIPPPHPELNRAIGYVIFADKEAADAAAAVVASCITVSASSGRPWVVTRQGQDEPSLQTKSDLLRDVPDGNVFSSEKFIMLTRRVSDFNAAKKRLRLFGEHRKQARVMFQRHAQEEKKP